MLTTSLRDDDEETEGNGNTEAYPLFLPAERNVLFAAACVLAMLSLNDDSCFVGVANCPLARVEDRPRNIKATLSFAICTLFRCSVKRSDMSLTQHLAAWIGSLDAAT